MGNINEAFGPKSFKDTVRLDRLDMPEKKSSAENCYPGMSSRTAKILLKLETTSASFSRLSPNSDSDWDRWCYVCCPDAKDFIEEVKRHHAASREFQKAIEKLKNTADMKFVHETAGLEADAEPRGAKIPPEEPVPDVDPKTANLRQIMRGLDYIKFGFGLTTAEMMELSGTIFEFIQEHYPGKANNVKTEE